jgi:hypothetical protein
MVSYDVCEKRKKKARLIFQFLLKQEIYQCNLIGNFPNNCPPFIHVVFLKLIFSVLFFYKLKKKMTDWFFIRHISSNKVVGVCKEKDSTDLLRSQVFVTEPKYTEDELWCWEDHRLKSKSTGLVLDIRKGK